MTADDFRDLALSMQGAVEGAHMGHPDFRAHGRIFASLHTRDTMGMVKLTPEQQRVVLRDGAGAFAPSAGAWGRQGCTNVRLAGATVPLVRGAMLLAWENATARPPVKPRAAKTGGSARPRPSRRAPARKR